ncbi:MAG: DUF885 domain-containing protein [Acidobacteria bacterium]|nr:DUF885 domain-containing protein [Acidobacteriota bacterium]
MGEPATRLTAQAALDAFFAAYYRRRPVTATFTGVHDHDSMLPDWSPDGLADAVSEMRDLRRTLVDAGHGRESEVPTFPEGVDLALADAFLEIQIAEHEGPRFYRGNASLWTGEAIFSVLSLVTRDFAPVTERLASATDRLDAIPGFLAAARHTLVRAAPEGTARAQRECTAAVTLFAEASIAAAAAFRELGAWIAASLATRARHEDANEDFLALLIRRGHWVDQSPAALLAEAREALAESIRSLDAMARPYGGWHTVQDTLAGIHPTVEAYLPRFQQIWDDCHAAAAEHDLVAWPEAPIRYVPIPAHTRAVAPHLYYLFYRSPAAFDRVDVYDYVVPSIDADLPSSLQAERLRAANDSVIKLNHVIHHGAIGHHVQNHHAYQGRSRVGQVAAIDGASRIGMFGGGTMAEGWACYACDLMEEVGFLTPLESIAQQQTRVRLAARSVVDLAMHTGQMTLDEAVAIYRDRAGMPDGAARSEAAKNSMFPGTAVMYWLGVRGLHALRAQQSRRDGRAFSLRRFHDALLGHGAIPVALVDRLMTNETVSHPG